MTKNVVTQIILDKQTSIKSSSKLMNVDVYGIKLNEMKQGADFTQRVRIKEEMRLAR